MILGVRARTCLDSDCQKAATRAHQAATVYGTAIEHTRALHARKIRCDPVRDTVADAYVRIPAVKQ